MYSGSESTSDTLYMDALVSLYCPAACSMSCTHTHKISCLYHSAPCSSLGVFVYVACLLYQDVVYHDVVVVFVKVDDEFTLMMMLFLQTINCEVVCLLLF